MWLVLNFHYNKKINCLKFTCSCVRLNNFKSCLFLSVSCWLSYADGKFCASCPGGALAYRNDKLSMTFLLLKI